MNDDDDRIKREKESRALGKSRIIICFTIILSGIWLVGEPLARGATVNFTGPLELNVGSALGSSTPLKFSLLATGTIYFDISPFLQGEGIFFPSLIQFQADQSIRINTPGHPTPPWPYETFASLSLTDADPVEIQGDVLLRMIDPLEGVPPINLFVHALQDINIGSYPSPVPLPAPIFLMGSGLFLLGLLKRRFGE